MNYFIQGIKNPAYDVVIISAKDYPVLAQQRKFEFKALLEGRLTACERCVMVMDFHEGGAMSADVVAAVLAVAVAVSVLMTVVEVEDATEALGAAVVVVAMVAVSFTPRIRPL